LESSILHSLIQPAAVVRKNHALEHATLQVLAARHTPTSRLFGYSDPGGFWVVGQVTTQALAEAAQEALLRLQQGEAQLAIHPNCGTNLATTGLLAGITAGIAMTGVKKGFRNWMERLPLVISLVTLAIMVSKPLGLRIQANVTTDAQVALLKVIQVTCYDGKVSPVHRVSTQLGS
jgi:hypothetical protein